MQADLYWSETSCTTSSVGISFFAFVLRRLLSALVRVETVHFAAPELLADGWHLDIGCGVDAQRGRNRLRNNRTAARTVVVVQTWKSPIAPANAH